MTAKEIDALKMAISRAEQHAQKFAGIEDRGASNFDTPMIKIRATKKQIEQMGWRFFKIGKRQPDGGTWYEIDMELSGQGIRRTRMAEAAAESLKESGYKASVHFVLD